jgi:hypothetical protein
MASCSACDSDLGAGYLCDDCDTITVHADLSYHRNSELRREICDMVGIKTTRYSESQKSFTKPHLQRIADAIGVETEDCTLAELYPLLCDACGVSYNANSGNQWKLGREQLKAIYRTVERRSPNA